MASNWKQNMWCYAANWYISWMYSVDFDEMLNIIIMLLWSVKPLTPFQIRCLWELEFLPFIANVVKVTAYKSFAGTHKPYSVVKYYYDEKIHWAFNALATCYPYSVAPGVHWFRYDDLVWFEVHKLSILIKSKWCGDGRGVRKWKALHVVEVRLLAM